MKLRLRPLRGQTYKTHGKFASVTFIEKTYGGMAKVYHDGGIIIIHSSNLDLPIIDTKDYEKIEGTKYKGD